ARSRLPSLRLRAVGSRRAVLPLLSRPLDRDDHVGDLCAFGHQRVEDARQPETSERTRAGYSLCPGQNETLGKNGALARRPRIEGERFWNAAPPQLFMAGVRGESHKRRARQQLYRNLQYLSGL